jgi:hypothetical protein
MTWEHCGNCGVGDCTYEYKEWGGWDICGKWRSKVRFCKDCAYYRKKIVLKFEDQFMILDQVCVNQKTTSKFDLVTGDILDRTFSSAFGCRSVDISCGPDAKYFKQKEQKDE